MIMVVPLTMGLSCCVCQTPGRSGLGCCCALTRHERRASLGDGRSGHRAFRRARVRADDLTGSEAAICDRRDRRSQERTETTWAEAHAENPARALQPVGEHASDHPVDQGAARLENEVHARMGEQTYQVRLLARQVPAVY